MQCMDGYATSTVDWGVEKSRQGALPLMRSCRPPLEVIEVHDFKLHGRTCTALTLDGKHCA